MEHSSEKKVVVNCILTDASVQTLSLNYSGSLKDRSYEEIERAKVVLFENNIIVGEFKKKGYAHWEIDFTPKAGNTYRLEVEMPNFPLVSATTTMPHKASIRKDKERDTGTKMASQWKIIFG